MNARILVVDDDAAVLSGLRQALSLEQFEVVPANDGEACLALADATAPDLIVLDVGLPGMDGFTVCERLRQTSSIPILMLTGRDAVLDRVAGLDRGADDYLVKPFSVVELTARIRALLRRRPPRFSEVLRFADLILTPENREAYRSEQLLRLTHREYDLLKLFVSHPRQALSRDQLCRRVWGFQFDNGSNFVDVTVKHLRQKLESTGGPRLIHTVRGFGYALREE